MAFIGLAPCHGPDLAEIVEQAANAAQVTVIASAPLAGAAVAGTAYTVVRREQLWGEGPAEAVVWAPAAACRHVELGRELAIGYEEPDAARRAALRLPPGVLVLCGAMPWRPDLARTLKALREAPSTETLLGLLADGDPAVRQQAFRQLAAGHLREGDGALLDRLLEIATEESDAAVLGEYLDTFAHFGYAEASPLAIWLILGPADGAVSGAAERAFPRLATPEAVAQLVAAYEFVETPVKGRILRALAPVERTDAQGLLAAALTVEETVLPALEARAAAGGPLPPELPDVVRDPVRRRAVRAFLARSASSAPAPAAPPAKRR